MAGPVGTCGSGRTIAPSTEALCSASLGRNGRFRPKLLRLRRPRQEAEVRLAARLSRRQAGTGGSGRSFVISVVRGRRPRFGSQRHLAVARPEQEVPAERRFIVRFRPNVTSSSELRAPEAGTGGSGRFFAPSSEAHCRGTSSRGWNRRFRSTLSMSELCVRGQGVTRPKYVSRRDPAEV